MPWYDGCRSRPLALVMELCGETIHRRNSVRQIAPADLALEAGTIT